MKISAILAITLFTSAAFAAEYRFTTTQTPQSQQEELTILRTVGKCTQVSSRDYATLTFDCGSDDNNSSAKWMLGILDTGSDTGVHQITAADGNVVRVDFLTNLRQLPNTSMPVQEALTVLRTVADIQAIYNFTPRLAIITRGTSTQVAFGAWLLGQMNQPVDAPAVDSAYPGITDRGQLARVDYLSGATTYRTQQILTVLRTVVEIQKVFNYTARHELAMRADRPYLAMADWIIHQVNDPQPAAPHEYTGPETDDTVRVFALSKDISSLRLQAYLSDLRTKLNLRRVFDVTDPPFIVARGTAAQLDQAAKILQ